MKLMALLHCSTARAATGRRFSPRSDTTKMV